MALLLAGCASAPPKPSNPQAVAASVHITSVDTDKVAVDAAQGVQVLPVEEQRLSEKLQARIDAHKAAVQGGGAPRSYEVSLHLTRYEKGNAFARAMLAGLGQIHIDATVTLYTMPEHTMINSFDMKKTFAWGGIYGASTGIETIEDTFCEGVAAALTGQDAPKPAASGSASNSSR